MSLATTYSVELILEALSAWAERRKPHYEGGLGSFVEFLLPAHITGLAVAMLLYANERLWPIAFAAAVAIGSKVLIRIPTGHGARHCLNPSNAGIAITLLLFPWVGIAPPYQFTENLSGVGDWLLPAVIIASGTFLNTRYTRQDAVDPGMAGRVSASGRPEESASRDPVGALDLADHRDGLLAIHVLHGDGSGHDPSLAARSATLRLGGVRDIWSADAVACGVRIVLLSVGGLLATGLEARTSGRAPRSASDWPVPARVPNASSAVLEAAE